MFDNKTSMTPNPLQQQILDLVHERRIVEHVCENGEGVPSKTCCPEPLLRLIHGLPGSGKTQVLRWLQSYFEEVWSWTLGLEFVFTAPLNSMASNIQGSTIHSWGGITFKDRRGTLINCQQNSKDSRGCHKVGSQTKTNRQRHTQTCDQKDCLTDRQTNRQAETGSKFHRQEGRQQQTGRGKKRHSTMACMIIYGDDVTRLMSMVCHAGGCKCHTLPINMV